MSDDWDFYALLLGGERASIYLDLGLSQVAPIEGQAHMAHVRVFMRQPRPDGLSSDEEYDDLVALEDTLSEHLTSSGNTTYAGRNTSSGARDFYFYTADPTTFAEMVKRVMAGHPHYQFETGTRPDPEWNTYFRFLYPSPDDLQRILNRRVAESLTAHHDRLSEPRPIDHFAYLPDVAAAATLRDYLLEQQFDFDAPKLEGDSVLLSFKRRDRPDGINNVVLPIARRIRELGGEYDGWGCEVVT